MGTRWMFFMVLFFCSCLVCEGQLVTKRDYAAAIALQAGGSVSVLIPGSSSKPGVTPMGGLKLTFPFTRKWFLGSEINYAELKAGYSEKTAGAGESGTLKTEVRLSEIQIPVYLKYMLNSNKESILLGGYFSRTFKNRIDASLNDVDVALSDLSNQWGGGVTVGYERKLARSLNLMVRVSGGVNQLLNDVPGKSVYPLQLSILLSYDMFRIGDCHCD